MSLQPGSQVGHYQILAAIGKGGMGEVWRARDTMLGRDVAIKVLPEAFAHSGSFPENSAHRAAAGVLTNYRLRAVAPRTGVKPGGLGAASQAAERPSGAVSP